MKNMKFPIDILWINNDEIVHIQKNVPINPLKSYRSNLLANYVLELNAGVCDKLNIKKHDKVKIIFDK